MMEFFWTHFVGFVTLGVAAMAMLAVLVCCAGVVKGYKDLLYRQAEAEHYRRLAEEEAERIRMESMLDDEDAAAPREIRELIPPEKRSPSKSAAEEDAESAEPVGAR